MCTGGASPPGRRHDGEAGARHEETTGGAAHPSAVCISSLKSRQQSSQGSSSTRDLGANSSHKHGLSDSHTDLDDVVWSGSCVVACSALPRARDGDAGFSTTTDPRRTSRCLRTTAPAVKRATPTHTPLPAAALLGDASCGPPAGARRVAARLATPQRPSSWTPLTRFAKRPEAFHRQSIG